MTTYNKGLYQLRHPEKYKGDPNKIIYRSSWELSFCKWLDGSPKVLEWASEPFYIPYVKPTDKKIHKYYPDFWIKYLDRDNNIIQEIIEIKPLKQTQPPKLAGKKKKQQIYEAITYAVNTAKWKATQEFCTKYGMVFRIISENSQFK